MIYQDGEFFFVSKAEYMFSILKRNQRFIECSLRGSCGFRLREEKVDH
jgi:hypothetical protein